MAAVLRELNGNCPLSLSQTSISNTQTDIGKKKKTVATYTKPLLQHSDVEIENLTKAQLQDLCRHDPGKLKVTGSCSELRTSLLAAVNLLRSGDSLPDLLITRKRNADGALAAVRENVHLQPGPSNSDNVPSDANNPAAGSLPSRLLSKQAKRRKNTTCPNNEHHWSFTRPICILCEHPKPAVLEIEPDQTANETALQVAKPQLLGLQEYGLRFLTLEDATEEEIKGLKQEHLKVINRFYRFPQSSHEVNFRVAEQRNYLLKYKKATQNQIERAARIKGVSTTSGAATAGKLCFLAFFSTAKFVSGELCTPFGIRGASLQSDCPHYVQ
jgi:hypothetical protein